MIHTKKRQPSETMKGISLAAVFSIGIFFVLYMLLFFSQTVTATSPVSARYLGISGDTIKLRLTISAPSPQSLILELQLLPGTQILATSPRAKQTNSRSGIVKWLFKSVSPGAIDVSISVSPAASARNVSGTVRYRMPGNGMTEFQIPH